MAKGGKREGAGRKSKSEELGIASIALEAITEQYGGLKEGFAHLLSTKDSTLIKFVFEHAAGKPRENVSVDSQVIITVKHES